MELLLTRDVLTPTFTLGVLTIDGKSFGYTCEDTDRGLDQAMPLAQLQNLKVHGSTAIPTGRYQILRTWSLRFNKTMMLVDHVPGFGGIRIHPGNDASDTEGCILPGLERDVASGTVGRSTPAWAWLDRTVEAELAGGEEVWLTVQRGGITCPLNT